MRSVLDRLRPHPHRGDVIAAGAVPLAMLPLVIEFRMLLQWSLGFRFAVAAVVSGLLLTMGWLARLEGDSPRVYHSVLLVCGLLPLILALLLVAQVLGAAQPRPGSGAVCWVFAVEALVAVAAARRFNSAVCTLIAALAAVIAVEAFVAFVFTPHGPGASRWVLLALSLAFGVGATRLRDHRRRHAVQLVNAGGIAVLVLVWSFVVSQDSGLVISTVGSAVTFRSPGEPGIAWCLYMLAAGFGLIAYASVDREAGPAYIGAIVLLLFAYLVGVKPTARGSFVGWPLFLLVIGVAGLVIGLRPRKDLPPAPDGSAPPAQTVPLRPGGGEDG